MLWKMWRHPGEQMLVVEAADMDGAFRKARDLDPDFAMAQPMDESEISGYRVMLGVLEDLDDALRVGAIDPQDHQERYVAAILGFYGPQGPWGWM